MAATDQANASEMQTGLMEHGFMDAYGRVISYCPYGCQHGDADFDDLGYCPHLLGFTNDKKFYEPIQDWQTYSRVDEGMTDTGFKQVVGGKAKGQNQRGDKTLPVPDDAKLVNPEVEQRGDDGIKRLARRWVSYRVYRKGGPVPEESPKKK